MNRGGSWNNTARNCRSAYRNHNSPDNRNQNLGFRALAARRHGRMAAAGRVTSRPRVMGQIRSIAPGLVAAWMGRAKAPARAGKRSMRYPTIKSVSVLDGHQLLVSFSNDEQRLYDVSPLLNKDMFSSLKNPAVFQNVRVDAGGYALVWDEDTDISEYELWTHGTPVSGS